MTDIVNYTNINNYIKLFVKDAHKESAYNKDIIYDYDVYDSFNYEEDNLKYNNSHCICDKSLSLHNAIVSKMLPVCEYIKIPHYHCRFCYEKIIDNTYILYTLDDIKKIYYTNPIEILFIKDKLGNTPLDLIYKFLKIISFEHQCPYLRYRTHRQLCIAEYELTEIASFLTKEKQKFDILCCASKFNIQLPKEMWDNIFEFLYIE